VFSLCELEPLRWKTLQLRRLFSVEERRDNFARLLARHDRHDFEVLSRNPMVDSPALIGELRPYD
jgi:hypothetical protein